MSHFAKIEKANATNIIKEIAQRAVQVHKGSPFRSRDEVKKYIKNQILNLPHERLDSHENKKLVDKILEALKGKVNVPHVRADEKKFADFEKKLGYIITDAFNNAFPMGDPMPAIQAKAEKLAAVMRVDISTGLMPFINRSVRTISPKYKDYTHYLRAAWAAMANELDNVALSSLGITKASNPWV